MSILYMDMDFTVVRYYFREREVPHKPYVL